jgi:hypothetical protein
MQTDGDDLRISADDEERSSTFTHDQWRHLEDWQILQVIREMFAELNHRSSPVTQVIPVGSRLVHDIERTHRRVRTSELVASERFPMRLRDTYLEGEDATRITVQEASELIGLSRRAMWSRIRRATERGELTPFVREGVRGQLVARKQDVIRWQRKWKDGRSTRHQPPESEPESGDS